MPEMMTPRRRVEATLNHKEPDRVPVTLGGSANHLTEQRYQLLRDHFGFPDVPRRTLVGFYTTPDYHPLLDHLGTDFRFVHIRPPKGYIANPVGLGFKEFVGEWGLKHRLVSGYYDLAGAPLAKDLSIETIEKFPWPDPYNPDRLVGLKEEVEDLYHNTDYAIAGHRPVYGNLWEMVRLLVGMENALLMTVTDTKLFDHLVGKLAEVLDGFYDAFLNVVGPYIQVIEIDSSLTDLTERARANRLRLEDVQDGTFTVSNLGMFGISQFRAVINPPESAILAVGGIVRRPVVINDEDEVAVRPMMSLTLSADHRVVDGVLAARFLSDVVMGLESPSLLLF